MKIYRGRFAPSPTGPLHFGSLVAAAGSLLEARSRGGEWLVRMEDLDTPLRTLEACGMHWDGKVIRQSGRGDAYYAALRELRSQGVVYPCACSRRDIAESAAAGIEGPVYPGTCRSGLPPGRAARALRIDTRGAVVAFEDAVQGALTHDLERDFGDFVLYRADDVYAYQLAVVVDDAEQGVTDIVRGADLLTSTPRQIYLQQLLGLPQPRYVHLPVVVDGAGEKLSKQTFATPVNADRPGAALVAVLAFLGQSPPSELTHANVNELWEWALENWILGRVPRIATAPAPPIFE